MSGEPEQPGLHERATWLLSVALIVLGLSMAVRAIAGSGGPFSVGVVMGALFMLAGVARLWLARSSRR